MAISLPFELVIKIIELAYYRDRNSPHIDFPTLSACATVCKLWSSFAQRLLFARVNLRSKIDFSLLAGEGGLGARIRSLALDAKRRPFGADFIDAVSFCPALYHLDLLIDDTILELTELEVARLSALPAKIRALRLESDISFGARDSRVLYQLMAVWPSVQCLVLNVNWKTLATPPDERPPFVLYELGINSYTPYPEFLIRWFLPPIPTGQHGHMRILSLRYSEPPDTCDTFTDYAPYVRSLRVSYHLLQDTAFVAGFTALEELYLHNSLMATNETDPRFAELPQTIQHIWFGINGIFSAESMSYITAYLDSSLPRLRRISVNGSVGHQGELLNQFSRVCEEKGLEFVLGDSDDWTEYPVPVDHFPREWTLENLYRMNAGG